MLDAGGSFPSFGRVVDVNAGTRGLWHLLRSRAGATWPAVSRSPQLATTPRTNEILRNDPRIMLREMAAASFKRVLGGHFISVRPRLSPDQIESAKQRTSSRGGF